MLWKLNLMLSLLNKAWDYLPSDESEVAFNKVIIALKQVFECNGIELEENWNSFIRKSSSGERTLANFVRTASLGNSYVSSDNGLILTTVHMSKGLEFDVVFIMGANDGVFPDYRAVNAYVKSGDEKQLIEERHNMFVAITRSKRLCYLTYPMSKNTPWGIKNQSPSRFLENL